MNEALYFGPVIFNEERPSNYIISCLIEDYDRGRITVADLAKRYNLSTKMVYALIQEVFPDPIPNLPHVKTTVLVYGSAV